MLVWLPVTVAIVFAGFVVGVMVTINRLLGPRRTNPIKGEAFECGNPPSGSAWGRFSVHFYMVALLFLVFDVEVVFLYPWAVEVRSLGVFGLIEALLFVGVMLVGLVYAWRRGVLEWE